MALSFLQIHGSALYLSREERRAYLKAMEADAKRQAARDAAKRKAKA